MAGYAVAVEKQGKSELYRQAFVDAAGHCETEVSEAMAAIEAMTNRLATGSWGDTSPEALNAAASALALAKPRFVSHTFTTPFNRAFYRKPGIPSNDLDALQSRQQWHPERQLPRSICAVSRRDNDHRSSPQCSTVSTNPAATSRAHSSRSCIARRRSARRLTRAVPTGGTPISMNLMRGLE